MSDTAVVMMILARPPDGTLRASSKALISRIAIWPSSSGHPNVHTDEVIGRAVAGSRPESLDASSAV